MIARCPCLVIFDVDGTIIDSQNHIVAAMTKAFDCADLPPPEPQAVRHVVGLSLPEAVGHLVPSCSESLNESIVTHFKAAFFDLRQEFDSSVSLFPGAQETVSRLSRLGHVLGVATGKSRRGAISTLSRHDMLRYFYTVQTSDDAPSKPSPVMLEQAMAEAGFDRTETVFVGDTTFDMEMAGNAGVAGVGVAWGNHGADALKRAGAAHVISRFNELDRSIKTLVGGV